jgi:predicted phosphodiesterase
VRSLVISDLHSNAEALKAVTNRMRRKKFQRVICLGDFVGYGAQPNQVLDSMRLWKARKLYIRGNHDRVVAGHEDAEQFNNAAKVAALWTREHLSAPNRRFLQSLPLGPIEDDGLLVCHGAPHNEDEYVFHDGHAREIFETTEARVVLFGHTHLPVIFAMDRRHRVFGGVVIGETIFHLEPEYRYLINPGSVGQPRDRNPAASFALFDSDRMTVQFFRAAYDIKKTQSSIIKAGLPVILAQRLEYGT